MAKRHWFFIILINRLFPSARLGLYKLPHFHKGMILRIIEKFHTKQIEYGVYHPLSNNSLLKSKKGRERLTIQFS